jgi:hypothetical protein
MPLGAFKVVLFGAAGSGGESGWVVQPYSDLTGSTPAYWMYDIALASDDSVWGISYIAYGDKAPMFHVESDGTLGTANDQKVLEGTYGTFNGRAVAVADNGDVIALGSGPINDGSARTGQLTAAYTPGTLVQDWDSSLFYPINTPGQTLSTPLTTKGTNGYGCFRYYDGVSKYNTLMYMISLTDGSEQPLNGSNDCVELQASSYYQSILPTSACVSADSSGNDWFYIQWRNSATAVTGVVGVEIGTTTSIGPGYAPSSGAGSQGGGVCGADANNLYFVFGDTSNSKVHLLKVAKSDGAIQWQRKVTIGSSVYGFDYACPPVIDSSGNVYVVWNSKDTQLTGSPGSSVHWAKWDSSGNIQTLKGTTLKTLTTTTNNGNAYPSRAAISSDDEFIYIGLSFGDTFRPFIAKFPTDGSGTDNSTALSGNIPGDDLYYKDNWVHTEAAGDAISSSSQSRSAGNISSYTGQVDNAVAQTNPGIYLDEVA